MINNSATVALISKDLNKTYSVTKKHDLANAVSSSQQLSGEEEQLRQLKPEYPFYQAAMLLTNSKTVVVTLFSPDLYMVNDLESLYYFANGNKLWDYCIAILGKPNPKPNQINYLFRADSVLSSKWKGDLLPKKEFIVRALREGKLVNRVPVGLKDYYQIMFNVKGQQINVQIYENYFVFNGNFYLLPDAMSILEKVFSAG